MTVTSRDGTLIAFDILGHGPALIYITGAICFRKFMPVEGDAKVFAKTFTVYNYDRRGRGDSGDTKPYSVEREVEDIEALIDASGGEAYLYGHSSGAVLALEAALKLKAKVKKVAIYDASYVHNEQEKEKYSTLRSEVKALIQQKKNASALRRFLIGIGMPKFFVYLLPLMPGWRTMKALAPTLEYDMELTAEVPPVKKFSQVTQPTLIMYGEKNPVSIPDVAKQLQPAIPNSELVMIPGQDHMVSAKILLPRLKEFFKA